MVLVRQTVMADWQALRDIRLQALRDAPYAFSSTYEDQLKFGEADWRQRITRGGTFLAYLPEVSTSDPAGMAGGYREDPGVVDLISMFVRPQARGRGVGEALIDAVIGWGRALDVNSVSLWVTETNKPALSLYERCGFTVTAERQPLPSNPALCEIRMSRPLDFGT
jgi:GNAT superfamily N-acetyltransferase